MKDKSRSNWRCFCSINNVFSRCISSIFLEFYFLDLHLLAFILAFICQGFQFSWVMASFPSFHPHSFQVFKFFYFLCSHFICCRGQTHMFQNFHFVWPTYHPIFNFLIFHLILSIVFPKLNFLKCSIFLLAYPMQLRQHVKFFFFLFFGVYLRIQVKSLGYQKRFLNIFNSLTIRPTLDQVPGSNFLGINLD